MEDYFAAKRHAVRDRGAGTAIVNVDDPYGPPPGRRSSSAVTFSAEGARGRLTAPARSPSTPPGRASLSRGPTASSRCAPALPGHFNVANALGAFAAARRARRRARDGGGRAWRGPARVPGRFEPIDEGQAFAVLVDYAHTPDSLENVLRAARRLTDGRLISVFGAGGDRDRDKRPKMGRAGAELSDLAVVTSDNPRSEDPEAIVAEVLAGTGGATAGSRSRSTAAPRSPWRWAAAEPGDTVVIAGKGHEQGQEFEDGRKIPFDDREVAREELRQAGQRGVNLTPRARSPPRSGAEVARRGRPAVARSGRRSTPPRAAPATSSSACAAPARDGGEFAAGGARGRRLGRGRRARDARSPPDAERDGRRTAGSSRSTTRWRRCRRWPAPGGASSGPASSAITGSVGKTSVKDIARSLLPGPRPRQPREPQHRDRAAADRARGARRTPRLLVLEMAMRGPRPDRRAGARSPSPTSP